jgi:hypothetical protein
MKGDTKGDERSRAARHLALAVVVVALAACVPTGDRPELRSVDTTPPTVLGSVVTRKVGQAPRPVAVDLSAGDSSTTTARVVPRSAGATPTTIGATPTTARPATTTTRHTTPTTRPTTTTTVSEPGQVTGSYQGIAAGNDAEIRLETPAGGLVASVHVTTTSGFVPFEFTAIAPGSYRVRIAEGVSEVSSGTFTLSSGGTVDVTCDPSGCSAIG